MQNKFEITNIAVENITGLPHYKRIERAGRVCYRSEGNITEDSCNTFVKNITGRKHYSVLGHSRLLIKTDSIGAFHLIKDCPQELKSHIVVCEIVNSEDDYLIGAGFDIWLQLFTVITKTGIQNKFINKFPEVFGNIPLVTNTFDIPVEFISGDKLSLYQLQLLHLTAETFIITTDRASAMQLRTYRNAAHSVESQRYCNYTKKGFVYVAPPEVKTSDAIMNMWTAAKNVEVEQYTEFIKKGFKPEFARNVLGQDIQTQMVTTASLWEWKHIFDARLNSRTQGNCRDTVQLIKDNLMHKYAGTKIAEFLNE